MERGARSLEPERIRLRVRRSERLRRDIGACRGKARVAAADLRLWKTPSAMTNEIVRDAKVALRGLPPHGALR